MNEVLDRLRQAGRSVPSRFEATSGAASVGTSAETSAIPSGAPATSLEERLSRLRALKSESVAPLRPNEPPAPRPSPRKDAAPGRPADQAPLAAVTPPPEAPRPGGDDRTGHVADGVTRRVVEIGTVAAIDGSHAVIAASDDPYGEIDAASVGKLVTIDGRKSRLIGLVSSNAISRDRDAGKPDGPARINVELLGEIRHSDWHGHPVFERGISSYPRIGARAASVSSSDLETIYNSGNRRTIDVGTLLQDETIKAAVGVDSLLEKHFAVLGTTGAGKSSAVSLLIQEALKVTDNLRVLLIDPHNEYRHAFAGEAEVLSPANIHLPFWLFNFEEFCDIVYRGRGGVEEEVDILAELIPLAKARFMSATDRTGGLRSRRESDTFGLTADTPVPYRLSDLIGLIDTEMGKLDTKIDRTRLKRVKTRIESVAQDPRYQFMFTNLTIDDSMAEILRTIFRVPADGKPVTIVELAGFPSEVTQPVVSVLARMAFDLGLWSNGALPLLFVCEEAHRYIPADHRRGFGPTVRAVSRIAKEGRKYNVHLGVVSQRPAELNETILAQCSTIFAMRLANEQDHSIIRSAVSDAAASTLAFLPSIGNREAIAFGEGVTIAMRLRFRDLDASRRPMSGLKGAGQTVFDGGRAEIIDEVIRNWRQVDRRPRG